MELTNLNWSDLKFFLAVARGGSLARAADKLNVTHSTVFRRLTSLEAAVGVKLFARHPEGYRLTEIGWEVLGHVERVSDRIDDLQRLLDNRNDNLSGVISVTAPPNLAYRYLPPYLSEFRRLYPEIRINLLVGNEELNLSRREADIAIRATSAPPEHLIGQKLFSLAWGAYASEDYLKESGRPANESALIHHQVITSHLNPTRLPAFEWVEKHIPPNGITVRCTDLASMAALALAGAGIALLPDDHARPGLKRLFTFGPGQRNDIWVLSHEDLRGNSRLQAFKGFIVEKLRSEAAFKDCGLL